MKCTQPEQVITLLQQGTFETKKFPIEECRHPAPREPEVLEGTSHYLCVWYDFRFHSLGFVIATPYVCPDAENPNRLLLGWSYGDGYVDHITSAVHEDMERVIAWRRLDEKVEFSLELPKEEEIILRSNWLSLL